MATWKAIFLISFRRLSDFSPPNLVRAEEVAPRFVLASRSWASDNMNISRHDYPVQHDYDSRYYPNGQQHFLSTKIALKQT